MGSTGREQQRLFAVGSEAITADALWDRLSDGIGG
jgi:hypothetical protein